VIAAAATNSVRVVNKRPSRSIAVQRPLSGLQDAERTWPGAKLANASLHRGARERCARSAFRIFYDGK
jgi:hypothetical protein